MDLLQIEKALDDLGKNMATKNEVVQLIDKKVAEDKEQQQAEAQKQHEESQTAIDELRKANDELARQTRQVLRSHMSTIKTPAGRYNGMWGDLETAKLAGIFLLASVFGNERAKKTLNDQYGIELSYFTDNPEKAMGEDVGTAGGILVPTELLPNVILQIEKYGVFRQEALEYPMGSDSAIAPKLTSGLTVYCPGAGVAPTLSDAAFQPIGMTAKKWMTLTAVDSELDEDSAIALGELIGFLITYAFAKKEDEVGFLGDGTSTYFGHTGIAGALRAVDATIGNIKGLVVSDTDATYANISLANFESLAGTSPEYADDGINLKYYCSKKFYYTVMVKLALAAGGSDAFQIMSNRVTKQKIWLADPLRFVHSMPKTQAASQICCIYGNLKLGAYLGDRRRVTIARSTEAYFTTDQTGIRGTERIAPTIHGQGDTTNAGPICGLILHA